MAEQFYIKQNDTQPLLGASLTTKDVNGADIPVDLTGATVHLVVRTVGGTALLKSTCEIVDALNGSVRYHWTPQDTSRAGNYHAEFEAVLADSSIITFPNTEYIFIQILEDLG